MNARPIATLVLALSLLAAACGGSSKGSPAVTPAPSQTAVPSATQEPATEVVAPFTPVEEVLPPPPDIDTSGWLTYRDDANRFELRYPPGTAAKRNPEAPGGAVRLDGTLLELPIEAGTTLLEKSVFVPDPDSANEPCRTELTASRQTLHPVRIVSGAAEVSFFAHKAPGVGGGVEWLATSYLGERDDSCPLLRTWLLLGSAGRFPTGTGAADSVEEGRVFIAMLSTFRWLD